MAITVTGNSYTTGDQVTAATQNAQVNAATFDTGSVDNSTTQLSGGAIIVKDGGITAQKLDSSAANGQMFIGNGSGFTKATLTAGTNIGITNGSGSASIAFSGTLPVANGGTGITSLGAGVATFLGTPSSANLRTALTDETGTGSAVFATSPTLVTPVLGTPSSGTLTNCTFPTLNQNTTGNAATVTTNANLTGHVTSVGNAAVLGSFTSAQLATALTNETGSGAAVFATSPTLVTPVLGTPASGVATNITGLPLSSGVTGTLPVANGGTAATTASGARTALGILGSNLNSDLASSVGVTQSGSLGADVVFNTTNAPTISITAGTWLVIGNVAARTSDTADTIWAQFRNSTDSSDFGGSAAQYQNLTREDLSLAGVITVTGTKTIYMKVFRSGSTTLDVGSSTPSGPSGFIQAVRLTT